jgi:hypothetical protein
LFQKKKEKNEISEKVIEDWLNPLHPGTILAKSGFWEGTCASMLF